MYICKGFFLLTECLLLYVMENDCFDQLVYLYWFGDRGIGNRDME